MRKLMLVPAALVLAACTTVDEPYYVHGPYYDAPHPVHGHVSTYGPQRTAANVHGHAAVVAPRQGAVATNANVHGHGPAIPTASNHVHGHGPELTTPIANIHAHSAPTQAPRAEIRMQAKSDTDANTNVHGHG